MRKNWLSNIYGNPDLRPWLVALALLAGCAVFWIIVLMTFPRDVPAAVLHYSVGVGIDFVGEGRQIVVLPAAAIILLLLNTALAFALRRVSMSAVWIMLGGSATTIALLAAAYAYILLLNT